MNQQCHSYNSSAGMDFNSTSSDINVLNIPLKHGFLSYSYEFLSY